MTPSELKYLVEQCGQEPYFFNRDTMRVFGDTVRNYGVRRANVRTSTGAIIPCWELWRKRPVKHGLQTSAYFDAATFARVHPAGN